MRLVCPHCAAAYDVPPGLLAGRSAVRCARCGQQWVEQGGPTPALDEAPEGADAGTGALLAPGAADAPAPAFGPPRRLARSSDIRSSDMGPRFGWAASVLALTLGAWSAVAWRTDVMHAWPPSERLYSVLGLVR